MRFTDKFDTFVCVGDTISAPITDKMRLVATVRFDQDAKPTDFDCYTEAQVRDWENDRWFFCGIEVSVQSNDGTIKSFLDSLWGIEANLGPDNVHLSEVANELIDPARILTALQNIYAPVAAAIEKLGTHA